MIDAQRIRELADADAPGLGAVLEVHSAAVVLNVECGEHAWHLVAICPDCEELLADDCDTVEAVLEALGWEVGQ